jgi:cytosine/adenosine deaminase-related metal-dependent hydrolase
MLRWLAQFLTVPIVNGFLDAYKAKLAAANAQGAQAAELARSALLAEIEARKSADAVIIAEQGRWYTAIIRPLIAAPRRCGISCENA